MSHAMTNQFFMSRPPEVYRQAEQWRSDVQNPRHTVTESPYGPNPTSQVDRGTKPWACKLSISNRVKNSRPYEYEVYKYEMVPGFFRHLQHNVIDPMYPTRDFNTHCEKARSWISPHEIRFFTTMWNRRCVHFPPYPYQTPPIKIVENEVLEVEHKGRKFLRANRKLIRENLLLQRCPELLLFVLAYKASRGSLSAELKNANQLTASLHHVIDHHWDTVWWFMLSMAMCRKYKSLDSSYWGNFDENGSISGTICTNAIVFFHLNVFPPLEDREFCSEILALKGIIGMLAPWCEEVSAYSVYRTNLGQAPKEIFKRVTLPNKTEQAFLDRITCERRTDFWYKVAFEMDGIPPPRNSRSMEVMRPHSIPAIYISAPPSEPRSPRFDASPYDDSRRHTGAATDARAFGSSATAISSHGDSTRATTNAGRLARGLCERLLPHKATDSAHGNSGPSSESDHVPMEDAFIGIFKPFPLVMLDLNGDDMRLLEYLINTLTEANSLTAKEPGDTTYHRNSRLMLDQISNELRGGSVPDSLKKISVYYLQLFPFPVPPPFGPLPPKNQ